MSTPIDLPELRAAWSARAGELGLTACDLDDVRSAAFAVTGRLAGPFRPPEAALILDELEGMIRRRRGRYRLTRDVEGCPAIVADAEGAVDNLAALLRDFRRLAAEHRQRHIVARVEQLRAAPECATLDRLARRHAVSLRTLQSWRSHMTRLDPLRCHPGCSAPEQEATRAAEEQAGATR